MREYNLFAKSDMASRWGVTRQVVNNWEARHKDFPPVITKVDNERMPLYELVDVEEYEDARGLFKKLPDKILDKIVEHRPNFAQVVENIKNAEGEQKQQLQRHLADAYLQGFSELTPSETLELAKVLRN